MTHDLSLTRRFTVAAVAGFALAATLLPATTSLAAQVERDCFWAVPDDPNAVNVAYPDTGANYWGGQLRIPPGGHIEFRGRYPHARYMSFNVYDPFLRPTDAIADVEIAPVAGSANPFEPGADRTVTERDYVVRVIPGTRPPTEEREPNTLYLSIGNNPTPNGIVIYRVYVPDEGRSYTGDTGLPEAVVVFPDGSELSGDEACSYLDAEAPPAVNDAIAGGGGDSVLGVAPPNATAPITWEKFYNLPYAQAQRTDNTPFEETVQDRTPSDGSGGYLSNLHNAYIYATADRSFGEVLVIQGHAPTFPITSTGATVMGSGQVRYWSICQNEANTTRFVDCLYDEQVPVTRGRYTIVMSTAANRPSNATPECGVGWIPWGPSPAGLPIIRHMLPADAFTQAIQAATAEDALIDVMGDYLPTGTYESVAEFEDRGCVSAAATTAAAAPRDDAAVEAATSESLPTTGGGAIVAGVAAMLLAGSASRRRMG